MDGDVAQQPKLCTLRQELELHPGPLGLGGSPTWTVYDPVGCQYYRFGWLEFELLSRWHLGEAETILLSVKKETALDPVEEDVLQLDEFLRNKFLSIPVLGDSDRYDRLAKTQKRGVKKLLDSYLFLKIPLCKPDRILTNLLPWVRWVFTKQFVVGAILLFCLSFILVLRQWDEFFTTFTYFFRFEGIVVFGLTIFFSKILHELAHALTAKHYGLRVPTLGVALLVFWPLMYTDASDSWRLTDRKKRMAIAGAGIMAELALVGVAGLFWVFLGDGPFKSACFLLATTNFLSTILFNINPFMRFDGYYILSDLFNFENLQQRGFLYTRWILLEKIFQFNDQSPEQLSGKMKVGIVVYSIATWMYRLVIIISISLLVYHLFFKLLGCTLLLWQLTKTVFKPLWRGILILYMRKNEMQISAIGWGLIMLVVLGIAMMIVPIKGSISVQSLYTADISSQHYSPESGYIKEVFWDENLRRVKKNDDLYSIHSPELEYQLRINQVRKTKIEKDLANVGFDYKKQEKRLVYLAELTEVQSRLASLLLQKEKLIVRSTTSGIIEFSEHPLIVGDWVRKGQLLCYVTGVEKGKLFAYISEYDVHRVKVGAKAKFSPAVTELQSLDAIVTGIDSHAVTELMEKSFASSYGGELAVQVNDNGALIPMQTYYKVTLEPVEMYPEIKYELDGVIQIDAPAKSVLRRGYEKVVGVLIRESVF